MFATPDAAFIICSIATNRGGDAAIEASIALYDFESDGGDCLVGVVVVVVFDEELGGDEDETIVVPIS